MLTGRTAEAWNSNGIMNNYRLVIGALSCQPYANRRDACRRTWLSQPLPADVGYFFLIGRPGRPAEIAGDILYLDCPDTYNDLPRKTMAFIEFALAHWDVEYLFKCDDDTYVRMPRLLAYWKQLQGRYDYIGRLGGGPDMNCYWHIDKGAYGQESTERYRGRFIAPWMIGGPGYFLSRWAAQLVAGFSAGYAAQELYEDKMVGDALHRRHIPRHHEQFLFCEAGCNDYNPGAFMTYHPATPAEMYAWYKSDVEWGLAYDPRRGYPASHGG